MSDSTNELVTCPSQTIGPFFHFSLTVDARLGQIAGPATPGERIQLLIRIADGEGRPIPDAMIELWQADAAGAFSMDETFRGWGRLATGEDGACQFETIRPGVSRHAHGTGQSPHINVCVFARGLLRHLFTRIYFDDDPSLTDDPVLSLVPEERRRTLVATRSDDVWRFDLRLQGERETVFFDL